MVNCKIATPGGASSGKTSLLSALLRELRLLGGEREVEAGDQYSRYALLRWAKLGFLSCLHIFGFPMKLIFPIFTEGKTK